MEPNVQQPHQPASPQSAQQMPQPVQNISSLSKILLTLFVMLIVLGLIVGAYYLGTQKSTLMISNEMKPSIYPTKFVTLTPTSIQTAIADITSGWKMYASSVEKASFKYPQDWIVVKPAIQSNYPDADQIAVQSPSGAIKVSWVSALSGFGGGCNANSSLGSTDECPLVTVISKSPITNATNLFVISGIITRDGQTYEPFLAVQDTGIGELLNTGRTMGYDMFTGRNNGNLPENMGHNIAALFSTGDAYAKGPSLSQSDANAWFNKPEVQQAKLILLSLTYQR